VEEGAFGPQDRALSLYPNPSSGTATLGLDLPTPDRVDVSIVDPAGRRVRRLFDGALSAGSHVWYWDGQSDGGKEVVAGTYLARAVFDRGSVTQRLIVVR
jgi:flagellar hook assembly protein FlgD